MNHDLLYYSRLKPHPSHFLGRVRNKANNLQYHYALLQEIHKHIYVATGVRNDVNVHHYVLLVANMYNYTFIHTTINAHTSGVHTNLGIGLAVNLRVCLPRMFEKDECYEIY